VTVIFEMTVTSTNSGELLMSQQPKMDEADKLFKKRKYRKAAALYKEISKIEPENAEAHQNLARCLASLKRNTEAETEILKALELNPQLARPHSTRGWLFLERKDYKAAEDEFREAIRLDSSEPQYFNNLALALSHQNLYDDAVLNLQHAIQLSPNDPIFHYVLSWVYHKLEARTSAKEEALKTFKLKPSIRYGYTALVYTIAQWPTLYAAIRVILTLLLLAILLILIIIPASISYSIPAIVISIILTTVYVSFWIIVGVNYFRSRKYFFGFIPFLMATVYIWLVISHWLTPPLNSEKWALQASVATSQDKSISYFLHLSPLPPFLKATRVYDLLVDITITNPEEMDISLECSLNEDGGSFYTHKIYLSPGENKIQEKFSVPLDRNKLWITCWNELYKISVPVELISYN
jgi:Flp pilus assembly protein TadD